MYVIFEGVDGAGKSTTMNAVVDKLNSIIPGFNPVMTSQPGSTPLGKHIRQLVKYPPTIDPSIQIDNLSRQLLYMIDMINYINVVLKPSLADRKAVFADRIREAACAARGARGVLDRHASRIATRRKTEQRG